MGLITTLTLLNVDYPNNGYQLMVNLDNLLLKKEAIYYHGFSEFEIDNIILELSYSSIKAERVHDMGDHYLLKIPITEHLKIQFH